MAAEIAKASEAARAAAQKQMHEVRDEMLRAIGRIDTIVDHGRAAHHQRHLLISTGIGAAAGAMLLMAILPGAIARSLPESWHVPEWMAARTIGLEQREAGQRMIETARPKPTLEGSNAPSVGHLDLLGGAPRGCTQRPYQDQEIVHIAPVSARSRSRSSIRKVIGPVVSAWLAESGDLVAIATRPSSTHGARPPVMHR